MSENASPKEIQETQAPESGNAATPPPSGYRGGYGYGYGYSYGYGEAPSLADVAGGLSETLQNRTLGDYIAIFRERIWYVILSAFIVLAGALVYTYNIVPEYTASGRVQVLRQAINLGGGRAGGELQVGGQDDFLTQVEIMTSGQIVDRVVQRLTQAELSEVVDPYRNSDFFSGPLSAEEVIARHRSVSPKKSTFIVTVEYTHRTKEIAKKMTDYFIDEICKYNMEIRALRANPVIETTRQKIENLEKKIETERQERVDLVRRENLLELDMGTAAGELSAINSQRDAEKKNYDDLLAILNEIDKVKKEGRDLLSQPSITSNPHVSSLFSRRTELRINIESMQEDFGEKHPELIHAKEQLAATEAELKKAVEKAEAEFKANFIAAQRRYESANRRAVEKTARLQKMREASTRLETLTAQLRNDEEMLQRLRLNLEDQSLSLTTTTTSIIQPLDAASVPNMPSNKKFLLNAIFALVAGTAIGAGIVLLLSFLDDRIKSVRDIEVSLGLPLLASVMRVRGTKKKGLNDRSSLASTGYDRTAQEAFISLYSALKIGDESKNAKLVVVTSTMPSEGKTFIASNVAQTYANHGEKVLLLDADLRLPNVANSLEIDVSAGGLKRYIDGEASLDDVIVKDVVPGMDVLPIEKSLPNPSQVINGKKFTEMLAQLRDRYDRVVIDTPPIAAVCDILNILPNCDGVIYTVKFNAVQRMQAKTSLRRLGEAKVPIFGAVLNMVPSHSAHFYTDKAYTGEYSRYYRKD